MEVGAAIPASVNGIAVIIGSRDTGFQIQLQCFLTEKQAEEEEGVDGLGCKVDRIKILYVVTLPGTLKGITARIGIGGTGFQIQAKQKTGFLKKKMGRVVRRSCVNDMKG
jgi:hypothetical protein